MKGISGFSFFSRNWRKEFLLSLSLLDWTFLPLVNDCIRYGLYGLKHHTVEICGDVTDPDGRTDGRTRKDRATQLLICEALSFAIKKLPTWKRLHIGQIMMAKDSAETAHANIFVCAYLLFLP